jgi:hypothetical protein
MCCDIDYKCITAPRQPLEVLEDIRLAIKVHGFSWKFQFLVVKKLEVPVILGTDFLRRRALCRCPESQYYFRFAPDEYVMCSSLYTSNFALQAMTQPAEPTDCAVYMDHLPSAHCRRLSGIIKKYRDVLSNNLGLTHLLEYHIRLTDSRPVRLPPYWLAPPKMQTLRKHIKKILDGVIEPLSSQYPCSMFLVPKPDKTYRAVVDYRALYFRIEDESVPLPDIHSAFH